MLNKMLTGMFAGPGCQNIAKMILLHPKRAKHTEREKNTCKQAAVHTPPHNNQHIVTPAAKSFRHCVDFAPSPAFCWEFYLLFTGGFCSQQLRKVLAVAQLDLQSRMKSSDGGGNGTFQKSKNCHVITIKIHKYESPTVRESASFSIVMVNSLQGSVCASQWGVSSL